MQISRFGRGRQTADEKLFDPVRIVSVGDRVDYNFVHSRGSHENGKKIGEKFADIRLDIDVESDTGCVAFTLNLFFFLLEVPASGVEIVRYRTENGQKMIACTPNLGM